MWKKRVFLVALWTVPLGAPSFSEGENGNAPGQAQSPDGGRQNWNLPAGGSICPLAASPGSNPEIANISPLKTGKMQSRESRGESLQSQSVVLPTSPHHIVSLTNTLERPLYVGRGLEQHQKDEVILACFRPTFASFQALCPPASEVMWHMLICYSTVPGCLRCLLSVGKNTMWNLKIFLCISNYFLRTDSQKWHDQSKETSSLLTLFSAAQGIRPWAQQSRGPGFQSWFSHWGWLGANAVFSLNVGHLYCKWRMLTAPTLVC